MTRHSTIWAFAAVLLASTLPAVASSESVVYSFKYVGDGFMPESGVVLGKNGALYGVTPFGGAAGRGAVYEVKRTATGAWTEKLIYSFKGGTTDGGVPFGRLAFDAATGVLYGTTKSGGVNDCGTVFKLTPTAVGGWTETVLYAFKGNKDGAVPIGGVTIGPGGVLYGTTYTAGVGSKGTVFKLAPPTATVKYWSESIIAAFKGGTDASTPNGAVVVDAKGNLYGTTIGGGTDGQGTVYRVSPPAAGTTSWKTKILYSFKKTGNDGTQPQAELILDPAGALYGTTFFGGGTTGGPGVGTVFKVAPATGDVWKETVIYRFKGGADSGGPQGGLLRDAAGALYGTTGGTVFKLVKPTTGTTWSETVLHHFGPKPDGSASLSTPIKGADGALYGTTLSGGANGVGTVFRVVP